MWNVNLTLPTLIILAIITAEYLSRKSMPLRITNVFKILLLISLLAVMADYISIQMDEHGAAFAEPLLWLINYLFFFLFLFRSFMLFWLPMYLFDARKLEKAGNAFKIIAILEQVFLFINCLNGNIFTIKNHTYISGPLYPFINLQFLIWIIIGFILLIQMGHSVDTRKTGIYAYFTVLLCGVIIRSLRPHMVIMNIFCMFAILIVYLQYLNPDQYEDDITTLFNEKGWRKVLNEVPLQKEFHFVGFGIRNFTALRETRDLNKENAGLNQVGRWIRRSWPALSGFYNGNGVFILASSKPFDQEKVLNEINARFELPWSSDSGDYYLRVNEITMPDVNRNATNTILTNTMWDTYPLLIQADPIETIKIDDVLIEKQARKSKVQTILMEAVTQDQLVMFLQPVVNTRTGISEGAEALCRLQDENGSYIYPDEFIPLAMRNGNMSRLGRQMFRKACAFIAREEVRFSSLKWINVNVAPEQFRNPNLLDEFLSDLKEYDLTPEQIHLEITEETMIDRSLLHASMVRFREKGFIFSMDDFGSSYSNMIRLQQNQFSNVKIDRDFTWSYFREKTSLLPDIIRTCHNLGMKVVTEGVETKEMADGVTEIGADYIQGYYYSKPIPADEFLKRFVQTGNHFQ